VRTVGQDYFDTVTYVRLLGQQCDDSAFRAACRLPRLEELIVVDTSVTDDGAEDLRLLTNLRSLDIRLNRITPRPLRHIGAMSELRELKLAMRCSPVPLSDEDMAFLCRLTKLDRLMLPSASLTDAWLVYLRDLRRLRLLELYDMKLRPESLDQLKKLSNLRAYLTLMGTRIPLRKPNDSDAEIDLLKRHPLLQLNK
jgi:hypothetical protein